MHLRELAQEILSLSTLPSSDTGLALLELCVQSPSVVSFMWHPLGFAHAKIWSEGQSTLRIHLWPLQNRRPQDPLWPIHTHVFNLESLVLAGTVHNKLYEVQSCDMGGSQLYRVQYRDAGSVLLATGLFAEAFETQGQKAGPGEIYGVPADMFHSSSVEDHAFAATLVRTRKDKAIEPLVLGARAADSEYFYQRFPCDHEVVLEVMRAVLRGRA
jgi:hypothetical protein